ncbi:MAG: hypothetical protein ACQEXJ_14480 [Myxococcota bacterium]
MSAGELQTTLRDHTVRLVTPDGVVTAHLVGITGLVLHLRLPGTPPALRDDVRVRVLDPSPVLGSLQFLVRAVTAFREAETVDVMLRIQKIFVGTDEITAARLLRELLPNQDLSPTAFDQVPRGVIFTCGPPRRDTREMIAAALGRDPDEPRPAEQEAAGPPASPPPAGPTTGRVHQHLLEHTHDLRLPLTLHVQGRRIPGITYRASLDGRRFFVCGRGETPTFGTRVDVTVDLPVTGRVDRALLVASVAWAAPIGEGFAVALRTSPQTNDEHLARWAASLLPAVRRQRARGDGLEAPVAEDGLPPEDAVDAAHSLDRRERAAAIRGERRVVTHPLGIMGRRPQ